jgi:hypothetical protein
MRWSGRIDSFTSDASMQDAFILGMYEEVVLYSYGCPSRSLQAVFPPNLLVQPVASKT